MERGASRVRQNAMRAGLVVIGSLAFGYLSLQVGFKPYLERAREASEGSEPYPVSESNNQIQPDDEETVTTSFVQEEKRKYKDTVLK